jgi:hypothetical protein
LLLLTVAACSRKSATPTPSSSPFAASTAASTAASASANASASPSSSATPTTTAAAGAIPCPGAGSTIQVGGTSVVIDCFRAQISDPAGVNIRSSPQVTPDNRTGSLAPGAPVEVEGRVLQGQEAEQGHGTLWYYVGTAGTTPQFIYGATGTLTPVTGSATPSAGTPSPGASPTGTPPTGTPAAATATASPAGTPPTTPTASSAPSVTPAPSPTP